MRRLPVYLLIDTSGSMKGEPIQAVNVGLQTMLSSLRQDPFAMESVHLSIVTYDREIKEVLPMTELEHIQLPEITTPDSGPTFLGAALEYVAKRYRKDIIFSSEDRKGDWMPLLFIMTDGKPSDLQLYRRMVVSIKQLKFGGIIGCAAGPKAKKEFLQELTDNVVMLDTTDSSTFQSYFKWVSASISVGNKSMGTGGENDLMLPPPPPEVNVVV